VSVCLYVRPSIRLSVCPSVCDSSTIFFFFFFGGGGKERKGIGREGRGEKAKKEKRKGEGDLKSFSVFFLFLFFFLHLQCLSPITLFSVSIHSSLPGVKDQPHRGAKHHPSSEALTHFEAREIQHSNN